MVEKSTYENWVRLLRPLSSDELGIRRLLQDDPEFRELCEDYSIAIEAFARWKADPAKAEHYQSIISELEGALHENLMRISSSAD